MVKSKWALTEVQSESCVSPVLSAVEPAAATPCPVHHHRIDEGGHACTVGNIAREVDALGNASTYNGHRSTAIQMRGVWREKFLEEPKGHPPKGTGSIRKFKQNSSRIPVKFL